MSGFLPSPQPWPLQILGVKVGDAIIMCNGRRQQIGNRIRAAAGSTALTPERELRRELESRSVIPVRFVPMVQSG